MECLHHAIRPKDDVRKQYGTEHEWLAYGIPATLVIDNGKEFIGHDLEDACLLLGIVLQYTPVRTPQFKAGVERMFGSLNTMFFHHCPEPPFPIRRARQLRQRRAGLCLSQRSGQAAAHLPGGHLCRTLSPRPERHSGAVLGRRRPSMVLRPPCRPAPRNCRSCWAEPPPA